MGVEQIAFQNGLIVVVQTSRRSRIRSYAKLVQKHYSAVSASSRSSQHKDWFQDQYWYAQAVTIIYCLPSRIDPIVRVLIAMCLMGALITLQLVGSNPIRSMGGLLVTLRYRYAANAQVFTIANWLNKPKAYAFSVLKTALIRKIITKNSLSFWCSFIFPDSFSL